MRTPAINKIVVRLSHLFAATVELFDGQCYSSSQKQNNGP